MACVLQIATIAITAPARADVLAPPQDPYVVAAGDIACQSVTSPVPPRDASNGHEDTTSALFSKTGPLNLAKDVIALGDEQYDTGILADFNGNASSCVGTVPCAFDQSWGASQRAIGAVFRPTPGNHEYKDTTDPTTCTLHNTFSGDAACGYESYFGQSVADPAGDGSGNYTWTRNAATAHPTLFLSVNAGTCEDDKPVNDPNSPCAANGTSTNFIKNTLSSTITNPPQDCVVVFWHQARWSEFDLGNLSFVDHLWQALFPSVNHGTTAQMPDLVIAGHDHLYERYGPLDINGSTTGTPAIPEIIVGTGGRNLKGTDLGTSPMPLVHDATNFGVEQIKLGSGTTAALTALFWHEGASTGSDPATYNCNT